MIIDYINNLKKNKKVKFLFFGGINTLFSFFSIIVLYNLLEAYLSTLFIATLANILNIFFSFNTNYFFVFKSGRYLKSLVKSFFVYLHFSILSIILIIVFVDFLLLNIWISQLICMCIIIIIMYIVHNRFTYK